MVNGKVILPTLVFPDLSISTSSPVWHPLSNI